MPELPEVEMTRRRLERELVGHKVERVTVRAPKLRLPVPAELAEILPGRVLRSLERRGKYLLFYLDDGCLVIHLGMTGFLRLVTAETPPGKHDHLDVVFTGGRILRFHDPRKFGTVIWTTDDPLSHPRLKDIGPEPLTPAFDGAYLHVISRSRSVAIKQLVMNAAIVAGVGNIYANEALFRAGIHPARPARTLKPEECDRLAQTIRKVLEESIEQGSTFRVAEETISYHPLTFLVYGRGGVPCSVCGTTLEESRLGNRSSVFCPRCQA